MMGNASKLDPRDAAKEFGRLLAQGEQIHAAYQLVRDSFLFTDRRLILVDKQGVTGKKVEYHSVPYKAITQFSVETAGHFDLDAELKIWVLGESAPIQHKFSRKVSIYQVQSVLAAHLAG